MRRANRTIGPADNKLCATKVNEFCSGFESQPLQTIANPFQTLRIAPVYGASRGLRTTAKAWFTVPFPFCKRTIDLSKPVRVAINQLVKRSPEEPPAEETFYEEDTNQVPPPDIVTCSGQALSGKEKVTARALSLGYEARALSKIISPRDLTAHLIQ
jgi:hypothetical protein